MPKKYNIKAKPTPPRFTPVGKYGIIDWREDCIGCNNCVKKQCVYETYKKEHSYFQESFSSQYPYFCKKCLRCVQGCTKGILSLAINPEYLCLGDSYWSPDIISSNWYQAETGKIPVSGAGYGGPFVGHGFDEMWTDMSEIVRPTRDGIHGREYISTQVDIGRKPIALSFDKNKNLKSNIPKIIDIPIPIIFNIFPFGDISNNVLLGIAKSAFSLNTFVTIKVEEYFDALSPYSNNIIPLFTKKTFNTYKEIVRNVRFIEFVYEDGISKSIKLAKKLNPEIVTSIKIPLNNKTKYLVEELAVSGQGVFHLHCDYNGNELNRKKPRFVKDLIRDVHLYLVDKGIRDEVTIIASGGIAEASHVAKIIICGSDLSAIDIPLLIALECRVCKNCINNLPCPVEIHNAEVEFVKQRISNLICSWHGQLIEVLGAMGLREVRRLRGEVGRCIMFTEIEKETFGKSFGERKNEKH